MRGQNWKAILDSKGGFVTTLVIVGFLLYIFGTGANQVAKGSGDAMVGTGNFILFGMVVVAILWIASKFKNFR